MNENQVWHNFSLQIFLENDFRGEIRKSLLLLLAGAICTAEAAHSDWFRAFRGPEKWGL